MSEKIFDVIGLSDSREQFFQPHVLEIISSARVFSGGRRHHDIVSHLLPEGSLWIDVTVPLKNVFEEYGPHSRIVVFASGDPLFYGYATTLRREFPMAEISVWPTFNSIQMLAHKACLTYNNLVCASLTGRPWQNLDTKLIEECELIGVLTDRTKTPALIAQRMLQYGYDNYGMIVGESLGNATSEHISNISLKEASEREFDNPNCLILLRQSVKKRYFGIPESLFHHLNGREKMITKMPIRLLSLSMLDLANRASLWDIGFCSGSISIEARLQFPHLSITAFEVRPECDRLMKLNSEKFGAPSIEYCIGDFLERDISSYPPPDAIFIGGHGGKLEEIMTKAAEVLLPGGVIVFNSVSAESLEMFRKAAAKIGKRVTESHRIALDEHNPITILKAE